MSDKTTYYRRNTERILNKAKTYYENNKEVLRQKAKHKYKELTNLEKDIKREHRKIDTTICLKKINKELKNIKNIIVKQKKSK